MVSKTALVVIAPSCEPLEAITIIDVLRRGKIQVTVAAIGSDLQLTMGHGVKLIADELLTSVVNQEFDLVVIPGGMPGANNLRDDGILAQKLKSQKDSGKLYAALCASPAVVFETQGLLEGKAGTSYPSFQAQLKNQSRVSERVVIDGNCITSQGPGTAIEFSLALLELLSGQEVMSKIRDGMLVKI